MTERRNKQVDRKKIKHNTEGKKKTRKRESKKQKEGK
jgi:hypothetical protein